jgi:hypothetical protein
MKRGATKLRCEGGARSALFLRVTEPKKRRVHATHGRRALPNPLVFYNYLHIFELSGSVSEL